MKPGGLFFYSADNWGGWERKKRKEKKKRKKKSSTLPAIPGSHYSRADLHLRHREQTRIKVLKKREGKGKRKKERKSMLMLPESFPMYYK
jgi:hypothetical protein